MKRISVVFLSLILVLSLVSCGKPLTEGGDGAIITGHYSVPDNASQASTPDPTFAVSQGSESVVLPDDIIQKGKAIEIALAHAGVTEADMYDLDIDLDYEMNGTFWEIDFNSAGYEYEYTINAKTEEIVFSHKERD